MNPDNLTKPLDNFYKYYCTDNDPEPNQHLLTADEQTEIIDQLIGTTVHDSVHTYCKHNIELSDACDIARSSDDFMSDIEFSDEELLNYLSLKQSTNSFTDYLSSQHPQLAKQLFDELSHHSDNKAFYGY